MFGLHWARSLAVVGVCLLAEQAGAGEWFDYWGEATPVEEVEPAKPAPQAVREYDALPFDWAAYADPSDPRFWDDGGDYQPPRPLLELARNPTPENAARYREWMEAKAALSTELHSLIWGEAPQTKKVRPSVIWGQVRVIYVYSATCGHCKRSAPTVAALREIGARVVTMYTDAPSPEYPNSLPYEGAIAQALPVVGTPTWVLEVEGRRALVQGYAPIERLEEQIQTLLAQPITDG